MAKRRDFTGQSKANVALGSLRGDKTVREVTAKLYRPNEILLMLRGSHAGAFDEAANGSMKPKF